ncbi:DNA-binding transcriptional regulator, LysR family [Streptomyces sp. DvalAA-14]|uniref:LysR family transcriptional regulator n=1 Tax=unclassified Streptomyces TaxID=2593676 RepID=UPI00081B8965|nr:MULTISPECIES: LysR family transcriptional regulator [unclassified Streptomyces]MYS20972.1 LysR family transcriptional regulator [Streptomyces sp. SID4948]SCD81096.1 DNA-binding transcriptional regulator, LysR family [Streptomyces sp. DvalAA-14]
MLDVRRLRVLRYLAIHGTVAATAEALHLTAPAISQHLAALDREAGLPVVEKHGRSLRLTAAGELLVAHAEVVLADLAAAESELAALKGGTRGTVRMAAFASAARILMPRVWSGLTARGELEVTLYLVEQEPDLALAALRRQETDLAIVHAYTVLPREFPPGCEHRVLLHDPVVLAIHPEHAAALGLHPGEPVDLARVAGHAWLTPGPDTSCYEMIQRACGAAGFAPSIRTRSSDFSVLTALVSARAGVALVPQLALPETRTSLALHPLATPVTRTIYTTVRAGTTRRPDLGRVLELLRAAASQHLAGTPHPSSSL